MEIEFSHVTYYDNVSSDNKKLQDVSFIIKSSLTTGIVCNYDCGFTDLISINKRPSIGSIRFDDLIIKKSNKVDDKYFITKNVGVVKYYTRNKFLCNTVKEEFVLVLKNYSNSSDYDKRIFDSLKMVELPDDILLRNPNTLSATEKNKLSFALVLSYNPSVIVFDNYELGLSFKEKEMLKKMIRLLKVKYGKTIIFLSNNVDFMKNFVDNYIVINNGENVLDTNSCYNYDMYLYTEMPQLVEFIKLVRDSGHNIDQYVELKELLKGIYRDVS